MITQQEKQFIVESRIEGMSFEQIGKMLNRPADSVRSVFNRIVNNNRLEAKPPSTFAQPKEAENIAKCKYCGKEFTRKPKGNHRQFCSDQCRFAWCNQRKRKQPHPLTCEHCGRKFIAFGNPKKRFCSRQCQVVYQRELRVAQRVMEVSSE